MAVAAVRPPEVGEDCGYPVLVLPEAVEHREVGSGHAVEASLRLVRHCDRGRQTGEETAEARFVLCLHPFSIPRHRLILSVLCGTERCR